MSPRLELRPLCRVVVDNDFSGDPDGLLALAHHLLAPSNRVVLITSSFLNQSLPGPHATAADGAAVAAELVGVVGGATPAVEAGSERAFFTACASSTLPYAVGSSESLATRPP